MPYRKAASKLDDIVGQANYVTTASLWNKKQDEGKRLDSLQKCFVDKVLNDHREELVSRRIISSETTATSLASDRSAAVPLEEQEISLEEQEMPLGEVEQEELDELIRDFVPDFRCEKPPFRSFEEDACNAAKIRRRIEKDTIQAQLDEVVTHSQETDHKVNLTYTATIEDSDGRSFYLASSSPIELFALLGTHFVLLGLLAGKRLEILSDGARWIMSWSYGITGTVCVRILCWYHLSRRVYESLSGQGYPKELRRELEREILGYLWRGERAKAVLRLWELRSVCRNEKRMNDLIGYLLRKKSCLVDYSERYERGEWIASTRVEKWNAEAVSNRCKHHGMSWTESGVQSQALYAAYLQREKKRQNQTAQAP